MAKNSTYAVDEHGVVWTKDNPCAPSVVKSLLNSIGVAVSVTKPSQPKQSNPKGGKNGR